MASAELWLKYIKEMEKLEVRTFADLAKRKSYKFTKSFCTPFLLNTAPSNSARLKSRRNALTEQRPAVSTPQMRRAEYWDALKAALADFAITEEEVSSQTPRCVPFIPAHLPDCWGNWLTITISTPERSNGSLKSQMPYELSGGAQDSEL